ncbi:GntR family transcriptional regulator, partial [Brucella anthropi]
MNQPATLRDPAFIRVANAIRDDILKGRLLSGTSLIEAELINVYDVSRNTLREAMQLLRQQGLVSQEPNKSVRVKRLTETDIRDIFVVRRVVELGALRGRNSVPADWLERLNEV